MRFFAKKFSRSFYYVSGFIEIPVKHRRGDVSHRRFENGERLFGNIADLRIIGVDVCNRASGWKLRREKMIAPDSGKLGQVEAAEEFPGKFSQGRLAVQIFTRVFIAHGDCVKIRPDSFQDLFGSDGIFFPVVCDEEATGGIGFKNRAVGVGNRPKENADVGVFEFINGCRVNVSQIVETVSESLENFRSREERLLSVAYEKNLVGRFDVKERPVGVFGLVVGEQDLTQLSGIRNFFALGKKKSLIGFAKTHQFRAAGFRVAVFETQAYFGKAALSNGKYAKSQLVFGGVFLKFEFGGVRVFGIEAIDINRKKNQITGGDYRQKGNEINEKTRNFV